MLIFNITAQSSIFMNALRDTSQAILNRSQLKIAAIVAIVLAGLAALFALSPIWKMQLSNPKGAASGQKTTDQIPKEPKKIPDEKGKTSDQQSETTKKVEKLSTTSIGKTDHESSHTQSNQKTSELNFSPVTLVEDIKEEKNTSMDGPSNHSSDLVDTTSLPNQSLPPPLNTVNTIIIPKPIDQKDPIWINAHPDIPIANALNINKIKLSLIEAFLQIHGKQLTCLHLGDLIIDDDEFSKLITLAPNIEHLTIRSHKITDKALEYLYDNDIKLKSIELANCTHLKGEGLEYLKDMSLTHATFIACMRLKNVVFDYLDGMPLTYLNLCGCNQIDNNVTATFALNHNLIQERNLPIWKK